MHVNSSFLRELRRALHHLYDWVKLSRSPLIEVFGVKQREDSPSALRDILREAIESLKPSVNVSPRAKAWRTYQVLYSRYVEQFTQREVASELGLSVRHLRREESMAVQTLAAYLWDHYDLELKWQEQEVNHDRRLSASTADEDVPMAEIKTPTPEQELGWLQNSLSSESVDVGETLQTALNLAKSLVQVSNVHVDCRIPESLPNWVVQPTPIQQALLITFTTVTDCVPGGQVFVSARVEGSEVCVYVRAEGSSPTSYLIDDKVEDLDMARQLIELSDGTLDIVPGEDDKQPFTIKFALPAEQQVPVLVIDDNVDTLRLLQRYLSNSRYRFIGTSDPEQALQLAGAVGDRKVAAGSTPQIIVLDVMLPGMDGWELLGRLREHPQTRDVSIVVCTILPQEQLALNLGAAAFIHKPVGRTELLSTLDHLLGRPSREPC